MSSSQPIRRALLSVSDKSGIVEFANALTHRNIEILSTGGTAKLLQQHQIPVIEISDYTHFPEIMKGRVKTLHPKIHGGILGRREIDKAVMTKYDIEPIDLVVVNLYPFAQTIENIDCTLNDAIENIDIGGPTMIRAAAKNYQAVTVAVDHNDYSQIIMMMDENNNTLIDSYRFHLAVKAFEHTAKYDGTIANYLGKMVLYHDNKATTSLSDFPRTLNLQYTKKQDMRYGENSHQKAAFYVEDNAPHRSITGSISTAIQQQGKTLSYNNIADADAALECVKSFEKPACVIVKHANPCGVAVSNNLLSAYLQAYQTDPTSAFGGIIAFNHRLDKKTAEAILARQFVEVIIAPTIDEESLAILSRKQNIRVLTCGQWQHNSSTLDFKRVNGGLLVQESDNIISNSQDFTVVTNRKPTAQELADSLFAFNVAKFVKSNAIVYAKENRTIGIGAGQMSRVYSAKIAGIKAQDENLNIAGCVMASDAFFPFRDGIDTAANIGIKCIIQPGGSMRDQEVIQAANEHNIAMIFTHIRHFRH